MKKYVIPLLGVLTCIAFAIPTFAHAQNSSLWKYVGNLRPVVRTWRVDSPGGLSGSTLFTVSHLRNCTLLYTNNQGRTFCGGAGSGATAVAGSNWSNTGSLFSFFSTQFVKKSGDSMTGGLIITNGNPAATIDAGLLLEVVGSMSGRIVHAQNQLRSSGTTILDGTTTINGTATATDFTCTDCLNVGDLANDSVNTAEIVDGSIIEPDLNADNSPSDGDVLTYDSTGTNFNWITPNAGTDITADLEEETHATEHNEGGADALTVESLASSCTDAQVIGGNGSGGAECQTDINTQFSNTGSLRAAFDARFVNTSGDAMTGTLVIGNGKNLQVAGTMSGLTLKVLGTASGNVIHAEKLLTTSGSLKVLGTMSGTNLVVSGSSSFSGTILALRSITTKTSFSGASIFGLGLGDCNNATTSKVIYNPTTGKLTCATDQNTGGGTGLGFTTAEGIYVNQAGDTMTGALRINLTTGFLDTNFMRTASGNILHAEKNLTSSGTLVVLGNATIGGLIFVDAANDRLGLGTTSPDARLDIEDGQMRFTNTTDSKQFEWGVDTTNDYHYLDEFGSARHFKIRYGGNISIGGGTTEYADNAKLEVIGGTASGTNLWATQSMTGLHLYAAKTFFGAGLTDCDGATSQMTWDLTTKKFGCGTLSSGTAKPNWHLPIVDAVNGTVTTLGTHKTLDISNANYSYWETSMPSTYGGNGLTIDVYLAIDTDTDSGHNATIDIGLMRHAADSDDLDSDSFVSDNSSSSFAPLTSARLTRKRTVTFTSGADMDSIAAGESFTLRLRHNGSISGNVKIIAVHIRET